MKLKDILNEITGTKVKVKDLTFDMLRNVFTSKYQNFMDSEVRPMYRDPVYLPKGDGSSNGIIDDIALDNYKEYIMDRVGDVEIILDPTTNKGRIEDPVFKDREERLGRGIQSYYDSKKPGEFTGD